MYVLKREKYIASDYFYKNRHIHALKKRVNTIEHLKKTCLNASQFFIDKLCLLLLKEYMISDNISQLCILRCSSGNE